MSEKKSIMDRMTDYVNMIAAPIARFGDLPAVASVQNGMVGALPIIIVGSLFLVVYVLGSPSVGTSGSALIPFLTPVADKFSWLNNITLSFLSLYCSVTISANYAEKLEVDVKTSSVLGLATFLAFTLAAYDEVGGIDVTAFSASGLFVCIMTSLLSVKVYSIFIKKGFTIKMPDSVPPNIGNSFAALVPFAVCLGVAWGIRTLIGFDMVGWLMQVLSPLISGADNIFVAVFAQFIALVLWAVGLHGDNMWISMFTPFGAMWLEENATALASGTSIYNLPHVLAAFGQTGLPRMVVWPAAAWPVVFLMLRSKVKYHRTLGVTCLAPAIFTIVEPVIFGLPLALNPFLMIPFILSGTVATGVAYALMSLPIFGKFFAAPPWATPPFLLGPLGTGDIKSAILPIIAFFIGLVIYLPFWRNYEKHCLEEEAAEEAANQEEA